MLNYSVTASIYYPSSLSFAYHLSLSCTQTVRVNSRYSALPKHASKNLSRSTTKTLQVKSRHAELHKRCK